VRKSKAFKLEAILTERIRMGDYAFVRFPSERKLAQSFGVTQMTARKAILSLESQGLLQRQSNGMACADVAGDWKKGTIAILMPAYPSNYFFMCQRLATQNAQEAGWQCRTSLYMHWDDAIIEESLERFDGVFLIPVSEPMPERVAKILTSSATPVVALGGDLSGYGLPSLTIEPENVVTTLLDALSALGHRKVDFLNAQPQSDTIRRHIEEWRAWRAGPEEPGELFDVAVESYGDSYEKALWFVGSRLVSGAFSSKCLLCSSVAEAIGTCRALASHGLAAGKDVSVASIGGGNLAKLYIPSITCMDDIDYSPGLKCCLDWMDAPSRPWEGPLRLWGEKGKLFLGESTARK